MPRLGRCRSSGSGRPLSLSTVTMGPTILKAHITQFKLAALNTLILVGLSCQLMRDAWTVNKTFSQAERNLMAAVALDLTFDKVADLTMEDEFAEGGFIEEWMKKYQEKVLPAFSSNS